MKSVAVARLILALQLLAVGCGRHGYDGLADGGVGTLSAPIYAWQHVVPAAGSQVATAVTVSSAGIVAVTGHGNDAVDFGDGPLPYVGGEDIFIAVYDADGAYLWSKSFGSALDDRSFAITSDEEGNLYLSGDFEDQIDFGGGVLTALGGQDAFVASFAIDGSYRWSRRWGGDNGGGDLGFGMKYRNGLVYLGGWYNGTEDFGGGPITTDGQDSLVWVFDQDGAYVMAQTVGGVDGNQGQDVAVDGAGNVYSVGPFNGSILLSSGEVTSQGGRDIYIQGFTAAGVPTWGRAMGSANRDEANRVVATEGGLLIAGGTFQDTVDFGTGPRTSAGDLDGFLAAYDLTGQPEWVVTYGAAGAEGCEGIVESPDGSLVVVGSYVGEVDLAGTVLSEYGDRDSYLAVFEADGNLRSIQSWGSGGWDGVRGAAVDQAGNIYVVGEVSGPTDFGGGPVTTDSQDAYLVRFDREPL